MGATSELDLRSRILWMVHRSSICSLCFKASGFRHRIPLLLLAQPQLLLHLCCCCRCCCCGCGSARDLGSCCAGCCYSYSCSFSTSYASTPPTAYAIFAATTTTPTTASSSIATVTRGRRRLRAQCVPVDITADTNQILTRYQKSPLSIPS